MEEKKRCCLQFFAEDGQEKKKGVKAADAGQGERQKGENRKGESLKVENLKEETRKGENRKGENRKEETRKGEKPSWEELLEDPEYRRAYDRQVQDIIKKRLRERNGSEERLREMEAALAEIGRSLGMEEQAGALPDAAELIERLRRERDRGRDEALARAERGKVQLDSLHSQGEALRRKLPDFQLERELENPDFLRLTAPHTGLSLEDAYYALHHRELMERISRESRLKAAMAVSSGMARPRELPGGQGASLSGSDPGKMTRQEREELKKRIYEARAQGRKLPYGS